MSMRKWVIVEEYIYGDDSSCKIVGNQLFNDYYKARDLFVRRRARQLQDDTFLTCPDNCIVDTPTEFSFYEDGNYNNNHYSLQLISVAED